ncbi:amidase [Alloyangia pacifica]|uniref:amidase n=1 Tax=Alloyangia pacifica TaxID=311180 RepID=UPI001CFEA807|nr:amidase [Alloyangia pacifica]
MAVHAPTKDELRATAAHYGIAFTDAELEEYQAAIAARLSSYEVVSRMPDEVPEVQYPRTPGHRPLPEDNPHNAWYWKTSVKGAASGKLTGKKVSLKDNIMLAGVPMMNGTPQLEGYVPEFDATIVTRILDAGGEILGKAHCELLCMTGSSFTNATGPVHNPWRHGYSAGGSSSGSAVTVATGEVDMSVGCDQGGSIRMPASFCGIYGMKPTHGLVPYTGIMPIEIEIDHAGPMTATVEDNALLLEVIAGDDGYDPRIKAPDVREYTKALTGDIRGMKIGVLKEGFEDRFADPDVNEKVRAAAKRLEALGAEVIEVSVPMHKIAGAIFEPIVTEGSFMTMFEGDGYGASRRDLYAVSMMDHYRGWRRTANDLSPTAKIALLAGRYITDTYGTRFYGKAMNISRRLRAAYDAKLAEVDLLLMPTTAVTSKKMPEPDAPLAEILDRAHEMVGITCPFDITHHPAMSVPCGLSEGLPVGMMLVGRHFDEETIYRAAHAFEQSGDWKTF